MNKFKIILDILMTILMVLLMKIEVIGLQVHEVIGITIFILFLIHKILNYKFVKAIGKNIFNKKLKLNSKIMFTLDIALLCFMFANVLTGILISKFILTELMTTNVEFITILHKFFAWWTLILISIHIGLHLDRLVNYFTRKYKILKDNRIIKVIILIIYLVFVILGIRSLCKYSIYNKIIPIYNNTTQNFQERKYQNKETNQGRKYQNKITNNVQKNKANNEVTSKNEKIPTLEEYLIRFDCGGCRKNCSLLYPDCEIGKKKREEKTKEYYEIYGNQKEENNNSSNNETKNSQSNSEIYNEQQKDNDTKYRNKSNVLDVINIICLFIGGTYYIKELFQKGINIII